MTKTFEEWKSAVKAKFDELDAVRFYLNEKGEERRQVFELLHELTCFCSTASELVQWLDDPEGLGRQDCLWLQSGHAMSPINRLRMIALNEAKTTEGGK